MSEEADGLEDLLDFVDHFLPTSKYTLRSRIESLRTEVRALRKENARLRKALEGPAPVVPAVDRRDPWAVEPLEEEPKQRDAWEPTEEKPTRAATARFACRICGELRPESELLRGERGLSCPGCIVEEIDEPNTNGRYR